MVLKEYYDGMGQRGRIDALINFRGDSYMKFSYILDYNTDQGFHVMYSDDSVNCTVVPLENDRIVNFTFREIPGPNGTVRIGSVNDLFQFGDTYNVTYVGQYYMRGILCDRWQLCFESPNMTYRTDYYFSVEEWSFPNNASRVPVVITVNGLNVRNGSNHTVANTYTFTAFTPGPPEDGVLSVPEGLVCKNRKQLKKLPSLDVKFFSAHAESTYGDGTYYSLMFYDKKSNLARFDYTPNPRFTRSPPTKMTTIHDFTQGVQYSINRTSRLCNISAIEPRTAFFPDETIDETGNVVLSSLFDLLSPQVNSTDSYVYEGESTVRGIPAEAWISFADEFKYNSFNFTFYNITLQLYFTKEQYSINGRQSVQIPILQRTSGIVQGVLNNSQFTREFSGESDIYEFDPTEPAYEVFDAFVCYDTSATKELTFVLPVAAMGMDFTNLRGSIRSALSAATSAPGSQFSNIQVSCIFVGRNALYLPYQASFTCSPIRTLASLLVFHNELLTFLVGISFHFAIPLTWWLSSSL